MLGLLVIQVGALPKVAHDGVLGDVVGAFAIKSNPPMKVVHDPLLYLSQQKGLRQGGSKSGPKRQLAVAVVQKEKEEHSVQRWKVAVEEKDPRVADGSKFAPN